MAAKRKRPPRSTEDLRDEIEAYCNARERRILISQAKLPRRYQQPLKSRVGASRKRMLFEGMMSERWRERRRFLHNDVFIVILQALLQYDDAVDPGVQILDFLTWISGNRGLIDRTDVKDVQRSVEAAEDTRQAFLSHLERAASIGPLRARQHIKDAALAGDTGAFWPTEAWARTLADDFRDKGIANWRGALVWRLHKMLPDNLHFGERQSRNTLIADLLKMTGDTEIKSTYANNVIKTRSARNH